MPRSKRRSKLEERDWLSRYEAGTTIQEIAREARRAPSTVWKGIEAARREREQQSIRTALLQDAYQQHFQDLLNYTRSVRNRAQTPTAEGLLAAPDLRDGLVLEALRQHVPTSPIWGASRQWDHLSRALLDKEQDIKAWASERVRSEVVPQFPGCLEEQVAENLWITVREKARGNDMSQRQYNIGRDGETRSLAWGGYKIGEVRAPEEARLKDLEKKHTEMLQEALDSTLVRELDDLWRRWVEIRDVILREVELISLRKMLPGSCTLCPLG